MNFRENLLFDMTGFTVSIDNSGTVTTYDTSDTNFKQLGYDIHDGIPLTSITDVNVINSGGGNKYIFNGGDTYNADTKYNLSTQTFTFKGIPVDHPLAILNNGNSHITYTGNSTKKLTKSVTGTTADGTYDFYHGDMTVTVSGDFGTVSVYCYNHGYMGGENLLKYSNNNDNFGYSVSLSDDGTRMAIAGPYNDDSGNNKGHLKIYNYASNTWSLIGDIDGEDLGDTSGWSVSLSGDGTHVAIGAPLNDGNGIDAGSVRVYSYDGTSWDTVGSEINGESGGDKFGWSVSLCKLDSGVYRVAIGAPYNNGGGSHSGHVKIYDYTTTNSGGSGGGGESGGGESGGGESGGGDGGGGGGGGGGGESGGSGGTEGGSSPATTVDWVQVGNDINGSAGDESGWAVSLSKDGERVAIGAPKYSSEQGIVRIYRYDGLSWTQLGTISGEDAGDRFGWSVSMDDEVLI